MTTAADDPGLPTVYWLYFDCTGDGTGRGVGRYGNDVSPASNPPVPTGCVEITKEEYESRVSSVRASNDEVKAALVAADRQAVDDRMADLVAVKVAEALAARDAATGA